MNRIQTNKALLAGAALAGILSGNLAAATTTSSISSPRQDLSSAGTLAAGDKTGETHSCAGKNSCKGKGGCKTGDNGCAGKNSCKGKGGCGMKDGKPTEPKK